MIILFTCFLLIFQVKSLIGVLGRGVSGDLPDLTSWRDTTANTPGSSPSSVSSATGAFPDPITWPCTWKGISKGTVTWSSAWEDVRGCVACLFAICGCDLIGRSKQKRGKKNKQFLRPSLWKKRNYSCRTSKKCVSTIFNNVRKISVVFYFIFFWKNVLNVGYINVYQFKCSVDLINNKKFSTYF